MYRHRGHRFITLRYLDRAVNDFEKAAELIRGTEDEVEPDGMPNDRGVPVSSLHFNIWYHLGLAYYCLGEMNKALYAYEKCWEASEIDDKYISTGHWYYMTLRRLGRDARAEKLLESFSGDMDIIENQHYHNCMMMYRGEMTVDELMGKARDLGALGLVTIGYGVANWYNYNGEKDKAVAVYREILALEGWGGFGYIAAEADMYHLGIKP
jgi:tetratricopeptide (TPR) repeat protein